MRRDWLIYRMKRSVYQLLVSLFMLTFLLGCEQGQKDKTLRLSGQTMGTTWSVVLLPQPGGTDEKALKQHLQNRLDQINRLMSTYDPESEISRFNQESGNDWFAVSEETAEVVELSLEVSRLTDGAFDVTVGPLVELWGFGATQRREQIPSPEEVSRAQAGVGYRSIELRREPAAIRKKIPQLQLDLSAVAKGYAVDLLAGMLRQRGIDNYLVEVGGELQIAGHRADGEIWKIAIEKPLDDVREVSEVFPMTDIGLATSGNYRNFYLENGQRYSHTLDPVSGHPVAHKLASVTVLDRTSARADALATALMVLGEEKGRQFCEENGVAAYFLIHDTTAMQVYASPAFQNLVKEDRP